MNFLPPVPGGLNNLAGSGVDQKCDAKSSESCQQTHWSSHAGKYRKSYLHFNNPLFW